MYDKTFQATPHWFDTIIEVAEGLSKDISWVGKTFNYDFAGAGKAAQTVWEALPTIERVATDVFSLAGEFLLLENKSGQRMYRPIAIEHKPYPVGFRPVCYVRGSNSGIAQRLDRPLPQNLPRFMTPSQQAYEGHVARGEAYPFQHVPDHEWAGRPAGEDGSTCPPSDGDESDGVVVVSPGKPVQSGNCEPRDIEDAAGPVPVQRPAGGAVMRHALRKTASGAHARRA